MSALVELSPTATSLHLADKEGPSLRSRCVGAATQRVAACWGSVCLRLQQSPSLSLCRPPRPLVPRRLTRPSQDGSEEWVVELKVRRPHLNGNSKRRLLVLSNGAGDAAAAGAPAAAAADGRDSAARHIRRQLPAHSVGRFT